MRLTGPVSTVVKPYDHAHAPRWQSYATFGDIATSWDCTHLHASPELAEKCGAKLRKWAAAWVGAEVVEVTPGVFEARRYMDEGFHAKRFSMEVQVSYHIPPPDYVTIAADGCKQCGEPIIYSNVVGGQRWLHLTRADHDVVIPRPWWDTSTGRYRSDNEWTP